MKILLTSFLVFSICFNNLTLLCAQQTNDLLILKTSGIIHPLEEVFVSCSGEGTISVSDGLGREYLRKPAKNIVSFIAGGSSGKQQISFTDMKGRLLGTASFIMEAQTMVDDAGKFNELFSILLKGMANEENREYSEMEYKGSSYKFYVPWDLDNSNVMNGIQYFSPFGNGLTDLLRETQRKDGMIWSFVEEGDDYHYYKTAYEPIDFFRRDENLFFVRQPVDNHSDYCYVNMFYKHWKASGNNTWMRKTLPSAALALDYCYTDSIRWSKRFRLLKRPYCIDSWDFQVDDEYTPEANISPTMVVVPGKTKYGVFFGDNTGYFEACNQLAEMYEYAGESAKAEIYRKRGEEILSNLLKLSWNGNFFTHFIDEDSTVKRKLGVDEKTQIAQSNMYSINRGLSHEINVSIIKTYQNLRKNLPQGSPGEWYAIYPPFERGFGGHGSKWQYMNGGIAGHAIGELARGAYESGYEEYASDILNRLLYLGKKYNDQIYFSYTGSIPEAPAQPAFKPVDISSLANMDLSDKGSKNAFKWMNDPKPGNDMRGLPVGIQVFDGVKFNIIDPAKNQRRAAIAVSVNEGYISSAEIAVDESAASVYLLHSISGMGSGKIAGAVTLIYTDGTAYSKYLYTGKDVTGWWFPSLKTERSGVAWTGPNLQSSQVGVCWTAVDNPNPSKKIEKIRFSAPLEGGIYALLGISLADKPHYIKPAGESFGGPDNWAAANGMAALIEGLAGVKNTGLAYDKVRLSPRWISAGIDSVNVTANLAASGGYISYKYKNNKISNEITLLVTGSGNSINAHVFLPGKDVEVKSVIVNNTPVPFQISEVEESTYVDFDLKMNDIKSILIRY